MVTTTVRFPEDLYQQVTDFARENDLSKNQVIKIAVRRFLQSKGAGATGNRAADAKSKDSRA